MKKAEQKVQSKADIFLSKVEKMKTDDERRVTGFLPHPIKDALADVRRKSATFTPAENFVHHVSFFLDTAKSAGCFATIFYILVCLLWGFFFCVCV